MPRSGSVPLSRGFSATRTMPTTAQTLVRPAQPPIHNCGTLPFGRGCQRVGRGEAGLNGRSLTMSHAKQTSKRKSRTKAVTALAVAGALSLAADASVTGGGPADHAPTKNTPPVITLGAEEISGVRVATFHVFDNENARTHRPGLQFVKERRHRGSRGSAGAVYGGSAIYGGGGGYGGGPTGAGGPDGM